MVSVICDHEGCDNRTKQPLPHGWTVVWKKGEGYSHRCPDHSGIPEKPQKQAKRRTTKKAPPKARKDELF
jgi:hypothetical protein